MALDKDDLKEIEGIVKKYHDYAFTRETDYTVKYLREIRTKLDDLIKRLPGNENAASGR